MGETWPMLASPIELVQEVVCDRVLLLGTICRDVGNYLQICSRYAAAGILLMWASF
jgi:hypothetical protein